MPSIHDVLEAVAISHPEAVVDAVQYKCEVADLTNSYAQTRLEQYAPGVAANYTASKRRFSRFVDRIMEEAAEKTAT